MDDQIKQQLLNIDGYEIYAANRKNRIGGGVCILAASELNSTILNTHSTPTLSAVWIILHIGNQKPIIVGCLYHPPNAKQSTTIDYKLPPRYSN